MLKMNKNKTLQAGLQIYGCSFNKNRHETINLIEAILNSTIGLFIIVSNLGVLILFFKYKKFNFKNLNLYILFMFNIFSGCLNFWISINYCVNLESSKTLCLIKFCLIILIGIEILVLTLLIAFNRLVSIRFRNKIKLLSDPYFVISFLLVSFTLVFLFSFSPLYFNWNKYKRHNCNYNLTMTKIYTLVCIIIGFIGLVSASVIYHMIYHFVSQKAKRKSIKIFILKKDITKQGSVTSIQEEEIKLTNLKVIKMQVILFLVLFGNFGLFLVVTTFDHIRGKDGNDISGILRNFLFTIHSIIHVTEPVLCIFKILSINKIKNNKLYPVY